MSYRPPVILTFSGLDPTGGAGIQADIASQTLVNSHCCPIITSYTSQDTHNVYSIYPLSKDVIEQSTRCLVRDVRPQAIKIGLLGSTEIVLTVAALIRDIRIDCPQLPVVFDPVLAAGGGTNLSSDQLLDAIREHLLPVCSLITPNTDEACKLADISNAYQAAESLVTAQTSVLLTGTHDETDKDRVHNRLYTKESETEWHWERLPDVYHGSGCTLASLVAGLLAHGIPLVEAVEQAQALTIKTLEDSYAIGDGQRIPNRIPADLYKS
ncbi:bifunctional hydroxymethylpyrimidine kinase/phosphomethylpyrimidine kinase [Litoribrevibacter albus]|nr:bifunctional hydroxymethylpyrimidine kinase/phosphomethylpyrimidine kinase [Litoribrevibacter albus]